MKELPEGYGLWFISDHIELTTPQGTRRLYPPNTSGDTIIRHAWQHRAMQNPCDCECWICRERGVA